MSYDRIDQVIPTGLGLAHVWLAGEYSYRFTPVVAWLVVGRYHEGVAGEVFEEHTVEAAHLDSQRGTLERLGVAGLHAGYVGVFPYDATEDIQAAVTAKWADVVETSRLTAPGPEREARTEV